MEDKVDKVCFRIPFFDSGKGPYSTACDEVSWFVEIGKMDLSTTDPARVTCVWCLTRLARDVIQRLPDVA